MSDPQWPSLREAARRFLKEEGCELSVPTKYSKQAWSLVQSISDHIPARLLLPVIVEGDIMVKGLFQIGGDEPSMMTCWIPDATWEDFSEQVLDLLEAGYPGCVGCGGPGSEDEWDEAVRRRQFFS